MSTNTGFIRPTTNSSVLRAKANNSKASNERSVSRGAHTGSSLSLSSMPSKSKHVESCCGSVDERMSLPEKPHSRIPQPRKNPLARTAIPRKYYQQVLTKNRVRALETQYQTLQCLQASFFDKLKSLGPAECKLLGSYKFVAIVLTEDSNTDDAIRMPQKLSSDCVQELKNCCQAAVDSGFMMFHDHMERIQLAKDELEACNQKEQLTVMLKDLLSRQMASIVESIEQVSVTPVSQQVSPNRHLYRFISELRHQKQGMEARLLQNNKVHNGQINRLKADLEGELLSAEANWQQTLAELKDMLQLCEAQNNEDLKELAKQKDSLSAKDNTIASQRAEMDNLMSRNLELEQLVKESEAMVVQAQKEVEVKTESVAFLEEELKVERKAIVQLQKRQDVVDKKDQIIHDLKQKILALRQFKALLHRQLKSTRKLQAGNKKLDTKIQQTRAEISKLQENLKSREVQLDSSFQREQQMHSRLKQLQSELFRSEQLVVQLQEEANASREMKSSQTDNETKVNQMYIESAEGPKTNQMSIQLVATEQQLSDMQGQLSCMEECIKLLNAQNSRLWELRDRRHKKDIVLEREMSELIKSINRGYKSFINQQMQRNFPLHGNYFRPLHSQLAQQQPHRQNLLAAPALKFHAKQYMK